MTILEKLLANDGPWELFLEEIGIDPNAEWVEPRQWNKGEPLPGGYYVCVSPMDFVPYIYIVLGSVDASHGCLADGDEYGPYLTERAAAQAMTRGDHLPKPATPKDLRPLLDEARAMIERLSAAMQEPQP